VDHLDRAPHLRGRAHRDEAISSGFHWWNVPELVAWVDAAAQGGTTVEVSAVVPFTS
jgi:hypothetical protein